MVTEILIKTLLVEDDENLIFVISELLKDLSIEVQFAKTLAQARELLDTEDFDLIILDLGLPDGDGLELLKDIKVLSPGADILIMTGRNEAHPAVVSLKMGVFDYIVKPFELNDFRQCIKRFLMKSLAKQRCSAEARAQAEMPVGESRQMRMIREEIQRIADYPMPVLITGETGTGKELVARAIHQCSSIFRGPFVKVDCGVLSPTIIESELFGYEKGAFTDAKSSKIGLVELARGGVLFFDEITNLPYELQAKLLQLIEERRFRRVGGVKELEVSLRIIAATNEDLPELVRDGRFREDLYWRLNVVNIALPPLRHRPEDILPLAYYFLEKYSRATKKTIKGFTDKAEQILLEHQWPGNVRELRNAIERAVIYCKGQWIGPEDLGLGNRSPLQRCPEQIRIVPLSEIERDYIRKVLETVGWNKSKAARMLGISRTTLREKIKALQI
jgi:DNA-binding NtrC family response regulator